MERFTGLKNNEMAWNKIFLKITSQLSIVLRILPTNFLPYLIISDEQISLVFLTPFSLRSDKTPFSSSVFFIKAETRER